MIVIADIIGQVVQAVSREVFGDGNGYTGNPLYIPVKAAIKQQLNSNVNEITYLHGHPVEIITTLSERDETTNELRFKKYPLIAMFQDMAENPVNGMMEASLQIIIATSTQPELKAAERYATTFKPILLPLYDLFLFELNKHKSVRSQYTIDHQKYDRVFWGTVSNLMEGTQVRMFNDYLDAVELQNMKLIFFENNC